MDEDTFSHALGNIDNYTVSTRLGRGKYSNVFRGRCKDGSLCVVKVLKPVRVSKISREIRILEAIKGAPHVARLLDVVRDPDSKSIALIVSWSNNVPLKSILDRLTLEDIQIYIRGVLEALAFAHARAIMHRDVKPGNIMFDPEAKTVTLIDWGLADYFVPGREYPVQVATGRYKGPELLFNYSTYQPSVDIWCLGATFASLLFRRLPFFRGRDNDGHILAIAEIFGGVELVNYAEKYALRIPEELYNKLHGHKKRPLDELVHKGCRHVATKDALDLLGRMLTVDHAARISAVEALNHPFFRTQAPADN
jgi:casein kinase II subunit alpha